MSGMACTNQVKEEEDATELKFGPDFDVAQALSMNEVMLIQESKVGDDRETYGEETSTTQTRVFEKTMAYAKRFANCTTQQQAHNMREACVNAGLHDFEVAMFVNIVPQNYDEAKTLVPSLMAAGEDGKMRFDEHHIENLISELNNIRQFD